MPLVGESHDINVPIGPLAIQELIYDPEEK